MPRDKPPSTVERRPAELDLGGLAVHALDGGELGFRATVAGRELEIRLAVRPALLVRGELRLLVDAGFGPADPVRRRKFRLVDPAPLERELAGRGLGPQSVLLTHLHFDHAGGALVELGEGREVLRFPAAEHLVHRAEWEAALEDGRGSALASRLLAAIGRPPRFIEDGEVLLPGVSVERVEGHTEGLLVVHAAGDRDRCLIASDLVPTRRFLVPRLDKVADQDPERALASRMRVLEAAAARGDSLLFYHDPRLPFGRLAPAEAGAALVE